MFKIITKKKFIERIEKEVDTALRCQERIYKAMLNPLVFDLKKLRENTWDKDKVDYMIDYINKFIGEKNV